MDGQSENFQKGIGKDEKILEISHRAEKYDERKENRTKQNMRYLAENWVKQKNG